VSFPDCVNRRVVPLQIPTVRCRVVLSSCLLPPRRRRRRLHSLHSLHSQHPRPRLTLVIVIVIVASSLRRGNVYARVQPESSVIHGYARSSLRKGTSFVFLHHRWLSKALGISAHDGAAYFLLSFL
jgi:hypothetical protein